MIEKFSKFTGITAIINEENIDTDAIIPASYLRSLNTDLAKGLFAEKRYNVDGNEEPDFILNQPLYRNSSILISGSNFGCGSSRESAVWAIKRFGFKCVIASSFGEIFYENSFKNGLLLITLQDEQIKIVLDTLVSSNLPELSIDLFDCVINLPTGKQFNFIIPESRRNALLNGLDEIESTLSNYKKIENFQNHDKYIRPWIYNFTP